MDYLAKTMEPDAGHSVDALSAGMDKISVREMKAGLKTYGIDYSQCVEKSELFALYRTILDPHELDACPTCPSRLDQRHAELPCGHRICLKCFASLTAPKLCPTCSEAVPDLEQKLAEARVFFGQYDAWKKTATAGGKGECPAPPPQPAQAMLMGGLRLCAEIVTIDTESTEAYAFLACALEGLGDFENAWNTLMLLADICGASAPNRYAAGNVLEKMGDLDGATAAWRDAIKLDPTHASAHLNLGNALEKMEDYDGAVASWREATVHDPTHAKAYHNIGSVFWRRKNDLVAAEAAFRASIAADPSHTAARRNLEVLEMLSEKQLVGVWIGDKLAVEMPVAPAADLAAMKALLTPKGRE